MALPPGGQCRGGIRVGRGEIDQGRPRHQRQRRQHQPGGGGKGDGDGEAGAGHQQSQLRAWCQPGEGFARGDENRRGQGANEQAEQDEQRHGDIGGPRADTQQADDEAAAAAATAGKK